MVSRICLTFGVLLAVTSMAGAVQEFTYVDLVHKLTDLEGLAVLPVPSEKCQQWSSYDRASRYDEATGTYVDWAANGDGGGIIRREGDASVVAEMEGPGVIWRIWSARPEQGHIKIYLDGETTPTVDLPFIGLFDRQNEPFTYPALVHNASSGQNCYVPIPFQTSCKITLDKGWGAYYQFGYTTYPKGTILPMFTRDLRRRELAALAEADRILSSNLGADPAGKRTGEQVVSKTVSVPAGKATTVAELKGPRAISAIRVKFDPDQIVEPSKTLREIVLRIRWDGEKEPSVRAPLGDFFGTAPGVNKHLSLPLGMSTEGECYSFWYMPFAKSATVELVNDGENPFPLSISITHAPLTKPIAELGRFHCKWHRDAFLPAEPERRIDWTMLKTKGRGRFCGVMLHVWNPKGGWWGEGDEKFFVDGEKFPSTIGTGSEDYFGYAWCNPALFQNAYHNQTISEGNQGNVSVNRWHITDNVPFQTSFEACIEKYYPNDRPTLYACTSYFYLAAGQQDPYTTPVPVGDRTGYYQPPEPTNEPGAIEGESLKVIDVTGGGTQTQPMAYGDKRWSGQAQMWWTGAKPGDELLLAVPVKKAGSYDVVIRMTKARDYGIVQLYLDGAKAGQPIDLYNDGVVPTDQIPLGTHELSQGEHRLTVAIVGANEKAVKSYMAGIDYIKLTPAE
jgi:hypothetical protein